MDKIHVYVGEEAMPLPAWNGSVVLVGRIPCVGEFVRLSQDDFALEVLRVTHFVDQERGTIARVELGVEGA